ncbi:MAG: hypothetical protein OXD36_03210 [Rhodobacter sp.]|nr:hypothetical protein [Rhodobacter sp.]MCY4240733.1 hypothetical protein [Rhodobacter sp.]
MQQETARSRLSVKVDVEAGRLLKPFDLDPAGPVILLADLPRLAAMG